MRYCSKCGSDQIDFKVPADDNLKRYVCSACDSIFYTNPNLIVGTICIKDEQVLLCKRNIEPRFGRWTLPAGFMENAETLQEGALSVGADAIARRLHKGAEHPIVRREGGAGLCAADYGLRGCRAVRG